MIEYIGGIKIFAGVLLPANHMECDGSLIAINDATGPLFSVIGTTYGGDGISNFALPDLRRIFPVGVGQRPGSQTTIALGQKGGYASIALGVNNLPVHTHIPTSGGRVNANMLVNASFSSHSTPQAGDSIAQSANTMGGNTFITPGFNTSTPDVVLNSGTLSSSLNVINTNTGNGRAISTMSPYFGVRYIICVTGAIAPRP
ncbi:MAG TPA: tail fiber protein [Bacteroidia bacterium]|jgi:microcystin-dependent protein|nr:tail fiber protein [Bacteroidia bacterium]